MTIERPMTIYADESGSPVFRLESDSATSRGFVACAAAVPSLIAPRVHSILPRNSGGRLLKAADRELSPRQLASFLRELLLEPVDIALLLLDTATDWNAAVAEDLARDVNANRFSRGNGPIKSVHLMHVLSMGRAIRQVWARSCERSRWVSRFFDVVIDDASIPAVEKHLFAEGLAQDWEAHGLAVPSVRWAAEEVEPLLRVPDLVAYVYRRQANIGDVTEALEILENALAANRIWLEDEFRTPAIPRPTT